MKISVFDLECDGFNPTKIHVLSHYTDGVMESTDDYNKMRSWMNETQVMVAHNCVRFDLPVLRRLLGVDTKCKVVDTLALSWYLFPQRVKHGLESWGEDFGIKKPIVEDWATLSYEEYKHRCEEDVKINVRLWKRCWEFLIRLYGTEEEAWKLIDYLMFKMECAAKQESVKWKLDVSRATNLLQTLELVKEERIAGLTAVMPKVPVYKVVNKPKKLYKVNGKLTTTGESWFNLLEDLGLSKLHEESLQLVAKYDEPNPNSTKQVKDWLYNLGWVPETFTHNRDKLTGEVSTIPQVNVKGSGVCESVKKLYDKEPNLELLDGLAIVSHRIGVVRGFLSNVDEQGFLQARVEGLTNTLRFKHSVIVNLPGVDKPYGEDIRGCLITPDGYELVGSDMSSLEDRTKQHYMWDYDPEYVREMMTPDFDPHIDLALFANALTKEQADDFKSGNHTKEVKSVRHVYKQVNYACVYGAGGATVGRAAGVGKDAGERLVEAYWKRNWSVKSVAEAQRVKTVFGQMWLYNQVSKFWYSLRAEKDRFSTLNQGTGVYCFDTWLKHVYNGGMPICGQFHDEFIGIIKLGLRERAVNHINEAMRLTNEELKLNRELGCSIQFGCNYSEIH